MARKKKHPEHENLERWLVSYADFITLLFATFTALYALSQTDAEKMKSAAESVREGFEEQSIMHGINTVLQGKSPPTRNPDPIAQEKGAGPGLLGKYENMTYRPGEVKSMIQTVKDMAVDMKQLNQEIAQVNRQLGGESEANKKGQGPEEGETPLRPMEVAMQERGIRVTLDSRLLFAPGSAVLKSSAHHFLGKVAARLKGYIHTNTIHVEGHTDDQPISTALYPSNWELSAARSSSVIRYFINEAHFSPDSLVAVGYGSTQPLTTNKTPAGRTQNRRVDIIIYNKAVSALITPQNQFATETPAVRSATKKTSRASIKAVPVAAHPVVKKTGQTLLLKTKPGFVPVVVKENDGRELIIDPKTKKLVPLDMGNAKLPPVSIRKSPPTAPQAQPAPKPAVTPAKPTIPPLMPGH